MHIREVLLAAIIAAGASTANATTLTFDDQVPGTPLTIYTQDGYTVAADTGRIIYGSPVTGQPTTYLAAGYNSSPLTTTIASLNVTAAGGAFTFASFTYAGFDALSPGGRADGLNSIILTGYTGGSQTFQQEILPGSKPINTVFTISAATTAIDRLNILTNGRSLSLDSFVVNAATAAVPEPASWAMMVGGFGLVGGAMRLRSKAKLRFA